MVNFMLCAFFHGSKKKCNEKKNAHDIPELEILLY